MTEDYRRIIVFFDLPAVTKAERKTASLFRKDLIRNGFCMLQYSVYTRFCNSASVLQTHIARLHKYVPENGCVRILSVTEKQYSEMEILGGTATKNEIIASKQLSFL
jgi:CRISPR-associated protein Cas2